MALLCRPLPGVAKLEMFTSLEENAICASLDVENIEKLICTERDGTWFHCHTRQNSGWVNAMTIEPTIFPSAFVVNDELPPEAQIRLRTKPSDDEDAVGSVVSPGTVLFVVEINGNWLKLNMDGNEAWLKRQANETILLAVPIIPKLYEKGPSLPYGCQLRVRNAPDDNAEVVRLVNSDHFLCYQSKGNWLQVMNFPRVQSPEWMQRKTADGTVLLRECKVTPIMMCVEESLPTEVTVRVRDEPDASAEEVYRISYWDVIYVAGVVDAWAKVICDAFAGHMLTVSGETKILQKYIPNGIAGNVYMRICDSK
jgi:hypothetical protein